MNSPDDAPATPAAAGSEATRQPDVTPDDDEARRDPLVVEIEAQLMQAEAGLAAVSRALERLESGTYGSCEECGDPIAESRLADDPTTTRCARHA